MYLPISNIEIIPFLPPFVAFFVSFFSSMAGVSGAFLLLPYQISVLGINSPSVSGTNQFYNMIGTPAGILRYTKEGRMLRPLTLIICLGTLPGLVIGAFIRILYLPDNARFKIFAGLVLLYVGSKLIRSLFLERDSDRKNLTNKNSRKINEKGKVAPLKEKVTVKNFTYKELSFDYGDRSYSCSPKGITILSVVVGFVGGIYGIGGGAIIAPFLVSIFRMPIHAVSGSTLSSTFVTSAAGVLVYSFLSFVYPEQNIGPDWTLGLMLGLGGAAGMYLGAKFQKHVADTKIRWGLAIITLGTAISYLAPF